MNSNYKRYRIMKRQVNNLTAKAFIVAAYEAKERGDLFHAKRHLVAARQALRMNLFYR